MTQSLLFEPYQLGDYTIANRVVMAPLTRNRAVDGLVPGPNAAQYYAQRATAGLIVAEATQVSAQAQGYQDTPGIYTDAQVAGWRKVTDAVHAEGGKIFVQLWHTGRISHVSVQPGGAAPVAPSAVPAQAKTFVSGSFQDVSAPRALTLEEIPGVIESFRVAAANAIRAGFDGVEVHGANGYLLDQFSKDGANHRDDTYGGTIPNRARLLLEVTQAVVNEIGANRTGVRISPVTPANGISDSDPQALFNYIVAELDKLSPVYLHVIEGATGGPRNIAAFDYAALRKLFNGTYMANNGYDRDMAATALETGAADLVSFGHDYVANPDLVERLKSGAPLAELDRGTLYGGDARGYTDYPTLQQSA
ncbi:alkene reductase [Qingshengfaniella alkalisoli]|uniref:Alkene reductase n=1 Tax=Qingshengfaniella alkalisoli TaxID=2599296 RepID=A0A5B8JAE6_9RHOB|nr:alkene reductase [Qingshengfaniella alkalisoli]QDY71277.1 alkene reductase [Qingshengfaniella alkalisoli]